MVSRTAEQRISMPVLRASWCTLTFVHWRVPAGAVQALLPDGLVVDQYDGSAWVSLTPFVLANMRPPAVPASVPRALAGTPRLPDVSSTPETNLRTYVRGPDGRDGLWFLSMDIGTAALAAGLRAAIGAPYHHSRMEVVRSADRITYTGQRVGGDEHHRLVVDAGRPIAMPSDLEVWLTSRWRAYTRHLGRLWVTPVEHEPWALRRATATELRENLTASVGIRGLSEAPLVHFSEGVERVRVGLPHPLRG